MSTEGEYTVNQTREGEPIRRTFRSKFERKPLTKKGEAGRCVAPGPCDAL
jgi:hypothetical protein